MVTLRYAWFGKLAFVAICLIVAVCLGNSVSVAKKKPKAKVIPEEKAKLVLQVPGLVNSQAIFIREETAADTTEIGLWRSPSGMWPAAWLMLKELDSLLQFIEGPPLRELLGASFQSGVGPSRAYYGLPQIVGEQGEFSNHLGRLEFQRFTLGTGIPCVAMRQYLGFVGEVDAANTPLGDTLVFGWYCAAPDDTLSDEMVATFLRGIGVKGIGLPPPPIMSGLTSEGIGSTAYKIAIFPFDTNDKCVGQTRLSDEKFANQLGALITSNNSLTLAYSHYNKYLNHPPIKTPGRLWKGSKPNLAQVLWLGETRGVDAVVMYWRATSTGGGCTDRMPPFPIDIYVIDVQQQKTYKLNGREENISALAEQALSRFLAGR